MALPDPAQKIRVLVVDDSTFVRRALARMFEGSPVIEVVALAADGEAALRSVRELRPDVVTLDVRMPVMDGLRTLEILMAECPTPVIMLSSLAEGGGENALRALELGAVDFVDKSSAGGPMGISALKDELSAKILVAAQLSPHAPADPPVPELNEDRAPLRSTRRGRSRKTEVVLIGCSTGGPSALQSILLDLPGDFPCPLLIVQHMPVGFTAPLAERLNRMCALTIKEAAHGEPLLPGCAYIAPAGVHLVVKRNGEALAAELSKAPPSLHVPAVDVLFDSAAQACAAQCLAVVLTGMGSDGTEGAKAVKKGGGAVLAESAETARVYGMPKSVLEAVKVDEVVPLYRMAATILSMVS